MYKLLVINQYKKLNEMMIYLGTNRFMYED